MFNYSNFWDDPTHAAAVDAHYYTGKTYDYIFGTLGVTFNALTGKKMLSLVDGPPGVTQYSPEGIAIFGSPTDSGYYKSSRAIDVVAHEFAHGISDSSVSGFRHNYDEPYESGALAESFSDAIGIAVKRTNKLTWNPDDWLVMKDQYTGLIKYFDTNGDDCTQGTPGCREVTLSGRRNLANPLDTRVRCLQPDYYGGENWCVLSSQSGRHCPDNHPCDRLHTNAGVPNKMFYLLSEGGTHATSGVTVQGLGMTKAIRILFEANRYYWPQYASMRQAMNGMITAAAWLDVYSPDYNSNDVRQVKLAWAAVGVGNTINVQKIGSGNGAISSNSAYLGSGYTRYVFPPGDTVILTPAPDPYSIFNGWYKEECGWLYAGSGSYTAIMNNDVYLQAEFIYQPTRTLTIYKTGSGSGTISGDYGISCGSDCFETYAQGAGITLTATPSAGSIFAGWSGACSGTGACTVTMNEAKTVTATFNTNGCTTTSTMTYTYCTQCTGSNQSCVEGQCTWQYSTWLAEEYGCYECWDYGFECDSDDYPLCYRYELACSSDRCTTTTLVCPPVCGNGTCESGETGSTCPSDCGSSPPTSGCGDGWCDCGSEDPDNCPGDCGDWYTYWYDWEC